MTLRKGTAGRGSEEGPEPVGIAGVSSQTDKEPKARGDFGDKYFLIQTNDLNHSKCSNIIMSLFF